ncbi:exported hypothetical protein [Desulfamplus magnetovallimortis]|uniref:Uncharacterized protein n=1 Tax=Desulfamplus magnetovallimortis TaxID=1246637 RepID=A0A1W1H5Q6_9BACT|nr:exported hypothetical protein [Desulfamplus magnetovallimortis]
MKHAKSRMKKKYIATISALTITILHQLFKAIQKINNMTAAKQQREINHNFFQENQ